MYFLKGCFLFSTFYAGRVVITVFVYLLNLLGIYICAICSNKIEYGILPLREENNH